MWQDPRLVGATLTHLVLAGPPSCALQTQENIKYPTIALVLLYRVVPYLQPNSCYGQAAVCAVGRSGALLSNVAMTHILTSLHCTCYSGLRHNRGIVVSRSALLRIGDTLRRVLHAM